MTDWSIYDSDLEGWWVVESASYDRENHTYGAIVRPVVVGEKRNIARHRGPFPTKEIAEEFQYRDDLESYWESDMAVYADHCLGCGKWAKVLAFCDSGGWAWRVTECPKCGILDSRPEGRTKEALTRCCNYREDLDAPCDGDMEFGIPEYVCTTCKARCGYLVHPHETER